MPKLQLYYFDIQGRAEVARMALDIGGVEYEDIRLSREQWAEFKPKTPYGQLPVLVVDGQMLAQSAAISRYCAKLAGLIPADDLKAALCDEIYEMAMEIQALIAPTFRIADEKEKVAARKAMAEGPMAEKLGLLDKRLGEIAPDGFVGGGHKPSHADLLVAGFCAWLTSGVLDGIPTDIIKPHAHITALKGRVASVPTIKARYEGKDDAMSKAILATAA